MKTHYSIADLLDLNLSGFPTTRRGWEKYVQTNNLKYREVPSRGKGGVRKEYELSNELKEQLVLKSIQENVNEVAHSTALEVESNTTKVNAAELMNWQREVAENRLFIVRYIQQQMKQGVLKTPAIEQFVEKASLGSLPNEILEAIAKGNAKAGEHRAVSRRSVFDWIKAVEEAEKRNIPVIAVLAPKQRQMTIPKWAGALLKLWGQPQKPTLTVVLEQLPQYLDASIPCPTYAQAYRFLNEKMGNVDVQKGRMGKRELKNIQPFIRRDTTALLPTDIYTADGHCFDAEVAHPQHGKPFRPELTSIIDVATRRLVGWSIALSESSWAVLDAIRMSATECGIPAIFYVDNGSGYKNDLLKAQGRGVLARLNTEVSHALPYNSQAKGLIERSHQTIWVKAAKNLPTYIGKDMDSEASNAVFKLTRNEIKRYGETKAMISWLDFVDYVAQVVEQYNNKPHSGLKRITDPVTLKKRYQTPLEAWNEALEQGAPIDRVEDWDAEDLFRPYEERKVRRGEIDLFGNRYFSADLEQYHGESVLVGYDIHDANRIVVRDENGRLICYAFWNANKRNYFPVSKVEQARAARADGRMRRLAAKQLEVLEEMSPKAVIEHVENQTIIPFSMDKREQIMAELEALPVQKKDQEIIYFKDARLPEEPQQEQTTALSPVQRWIAIDNQILNGKEVTEQDRTFWEMFQVSKKFKQSSLDDETLKTHLERRQA